MLGDFQDGLVPDSLIVFAAVLLRGASTRTWCHPSAVSMLSLTSSTRELRVRFRLLVAHSRWTGVSGSDVWAREKIEFSAWERADFIATFKKKLGDGMINCIDSPSVVYCNSGIARLGQGSRRTA